MVQRGHQVTVISSNSEKRPAIEALGASAAIGSLEDVDFLTSTLTGADALFAMVPPKIAEPDHHGYFRGIVSSYIKAIERSGVKRVIYLSSWGADLSEGTGFIVGHNDAENRLNELSGVDITHLRAGYIYSNLYAFVNMIKNMGNIGSNYGGEDKLVLVHSSDIAAAAAEEFETMDNGYRVRYVASDERTASETAKVLGDAIGKPGLQWMTFSDQQTQEGLQLTGMPPFMAASLVELGASIHSGALGRDYELHKPKSLGKIKIKDFAKDFTAAFQA